MRPKTKDCAQKLTLTLSAPARETLMAEAFRRGVSRTQIVEDLILQFTNKQKLKKGVKTGIVKLNDSQENH